MERQNNFSMINKKGEWKSIKILGTEYVICTSAMKNSWKITLSNLVEIWTETVTKDIALVRCQSLNLLLDLDSFDIKETLDAMLNDIPKHATNKSLDEIKLETCIDGIAFKFTINLTKGSPQQFWNEITKPLCQSSKELQRRHEIMLDLIKKKDQELSEYRLSGAQLIRKNIETLPYSEDIFRNKISIRSSKSDDCVTAFQSMMDLYNELIECESLLHNIHKRLPQKSSEPNPAEPVIKIKRENIETSEIMSTVNINNGNELQTRNNTGTSREHCLIDVNELIVPKTEVIEQYGVDQTRPSVSESKIDLRVKRNPKEQSTMDNVTKMPLTPVEQPSKRLERPKKTRNIYDFIK